MNKSDERNRMLRAFAQKRAVEFQNWDLLDQAFVHTSYINEHRFEGRAQNERLEFLGDAVLELVVTEFLYNHFPKKPEGELTSLRAALVKGRHLADISRSLGVGELLLLSKGEEKSGGREKNYLLANALEAFIGALYLDQGFAVAHQFIHDCILKNLGEILDKGLHVDSKSRLQEIVQDRYSVTPHYDVLSAQGPDHDKSFEVGVYMGEKMIGSGKGTSKQNAEQEAAQDALRNL